VDNPYTETLKPLWENKARVHVFVDENKLEELAEKLKKENLIVPPWDAPNVQPPLDCALEEWINYVCWINTLNFAFTNFEPPYEKFTIEYPGGEFKKGAFALGASYMRALREGFPFHDASAMSKISWEEVNYIFRPIDNEHKMPMLLKRWRIVREVADELLEGHDGRWIDLFHRGNWRAFNDNDGIVERLENGFLSFGDFRRHDKQLLCFHKRAQLLVMMHQDRALNSNGRFPQIKDAENLGPPCDYDLPRALESLGVLHYSDILKEKIKNHIILPENSREEIEIRVATWYAMEKLCEILDIWIGPVDFKIWSLGRELKEPHHLTPTIAY